MLAIGIVVLAAAFIANDLRRRGRGGGYWDRSLQSGLSILMIGLFLMAREAGPSGQGGDALQAFLLAAAVLLLVRAMLGPRRPRDADGPAE